MADMVICGLTPFESKIVKEHKGECNYCIHFDAYYYGSKDNPYYSCDKHKKRLEKPMTNCEDWFVDTR